MPPYFRLLGHPLAKLVIISYDSGAVTEFKAIWPVYIKNIKSFHQQK